MPGKSGYRVVLSFLAEPSFLSKLNTCKGHRTGHTALAMFARATSMQEKMQQKWKARIAQFSKDRTAVLAAFGRQIEQARGQEAVLNVEEHCLSHRAASPSLSYRGAATTLPKQPWGDQQAEEPDEGGRHNIPPALVKRQEAANPSSLRILL